jgi:hypothetical protein
MGHELIVHTVITGSQAMDDTINGFAHIVNSFSANEIVVWLNPYWGVIEHEGKSFEQMKVYTSNKAEYRLSSKSPI